MSKKKFKGKIIFTVNYFFSLKWKVKYSLAKWKITHFQNINQCFNQIELIDIWYLKE